MEMTAIKMVKQKQCSNVSSSSSQRRRARSQRAKRRNRNKRGKSISRLKIKSLTDEMNRKKRERPKPVADWFSLEFDYARFCWKKLEKCVCHFDVCRCIAFQWNKKSLTQTTDGSFVIGVKGMKTTNGKSRVSWCRKNTWKKAHRHRRPKAMQ